MQDRDQAGGAAASRPYVALLRGINVGGHRKLLMRDFVTGALFAGCTRWLAKLEGDRTRGARHEACIRVDAGLLTDSPRR